MKVGELLGLIACLIIMTFRSLNVEYIAANSCFEITNEKIENPGVLENMFQSGQI